MCSTAHGPAETGAEARGLRPAPGRGATVDAAAPAQLPARLKLRRGPAGAGGGESVADSEVDSCELIDLVEGELYAAVPPRVASSVPSMPAPAAPHRPLPHCAAPTRAGKQTLEEMLQSRSKPGKGTPQQARQGDAPSGARLCPPPRGPPGQTERRSGRAPPLPSASGARGEARVNLASERAGVRQHRPATARAAAWGAGADNTRAQSDSGHEDDDGSSTTPNEESSESALMEEAVCPTAVSASSLQSDSSVLLPDSTSDAADHARAPRRANSAGGDDDATRRRGRGASRREAPDICDGDSCGDGSAPLRDTCEDRDSEHRVSGARERDYSRECGYREREREREKMETEIEIEERKRDRQALSGWGNTAMLLEDDESSSSIASSGISDIQREREAYWGAGYGGGGGGYGVGGALEAGGSAKAITAGVGGMQGGREGVLMLGQGGEEEEEEEEELNVRLLRELKAQEHQPRLVPGMGEATFDPPQHLGKFARL